MSEKYCNLTQGGGLRFFKLSFYVQRRVKLRKRKEDKSRRKTDGTGQYANFVLMRNNSVVILRPVLVKFYRTGEETAFERHRSRVLINKEQKQLLLNLVLTINPRTYKRTRTPPPPTVLQRGGEEIRTNTRWIFRAIKAQGNKFT